MSGKKRSAFAVYQQLQKETLQEHAAEERGAESPMASSHTTTTTTSTTDGSPGASVEGKKRKAGHKKAALKNAKKRKLLAGAASHNEDYSEIGSDVKLSKHAKLKLRRKQLKMSAYRRKVAKETKKKKRKVVPEDINMVAMADSNQEVDVHGGEGSQEGRTPGGGSGTLPSLSSNLDLPFHSQFNPDNHQDSRVAARELFQLLISPLSVEKFYSDVWEEKPLLLRRHKPHYNDGWFSSEELDSILRKHHVEYTTNIDITSYENGKRQTHNPTGRAHASGVWEFYKEGCSVRLLNPQTFSQSMWLLNSTLQEHFNSCVGANVYLTPAHSQGFAPHYDDIEAFVLQLEGKKHWRLYSPRDDSEVLPRYSSCNFSQAEIGEPILDAVLEPGDLLYFPRGTIHQAFTPPDSHSLHITLSACQMNTWGDLLEKLVPAALQVAMSEDMEFRRALPLDYLDYMGVVNADLSDDSMRKGFLEKITEFMAKLIQYAPIDGAADQMGANHLYNCLPPCLTEKEEQNGVWGKGARWERGEIRDDGAEFTGSTRVKFIRHGVARLVLEEEGPVLYHNLQNSRVYHEKDKQGIIINQEDAPAVEYLLRCYPGYVTVESLPMDEATTEEKVELCQSLYSQGLLLIES